MMCWKNPISVGGDLGKLYEFENLEVVNQISHFENLRLH